MESLAKTYEGKADFYILYVREAHPGENYSAHKSLSGKIAHAKDLQQFENVCRTILIDDVEGSMHIDYGDRPNSVYLIGKDGVISYRADWSEPVEFEEQLKRVLENDGYAAGLEAVSLTDNFTPVTSESAETSIRVLRRSGWGALVDFWFSSPALARGRRVRHPAVVRVPLRKVTVVRGPELANP